MKHKNIVNFTLNRHTVLAWFHDVKGSIPAFAFGAFLPCPQASSTTCPEAETLHVTEASDAVTEVEDLVTVGAEQLQLWFVYSQPLCLLST